MKLLEKKSIAILAALLCVFLWGSAFPILKLAYESLNIQTDAIAKIQFSGLRFFFAGIIILLIGKRFGGPDFQPQGNHFVYLVVLGLIGVSIQYSFSSIGIGNTTGMKASIIQSSNGFMILLAATLILRIEKLRASHILSMILGFGGVLVANVTKDFDFSFHLMGEGFMVVSAITAAISTLMIKWYKPKIHPYFTAGWHMIFGSLPMIMLGYAFTEPIQYNAMGLIYWTGTVFIASVSFMIWYSIIQIHPVAEMSLYLMFIPVFASILSIIMLGEMFRWSTALALVLVMLGMLVQRLDARRIEIES